MDIISTNPITSYKRDTPIQEQVFPIKPFEELNLMDSFLFESATEKPENAVIIARVIIERATGRKVEKLIVHPQKDLKGININKHGIRMDVYTEELEETGDGNAVTCVYDIEPNNYNEKDIPRRNRYYQSMIDSKLLPTGETYQKLPEFFSIWLLPYDPFGDNRMLYTVKNLVAENNQIVYNDGVTKIFLYTGGTVGGTRELKALLDFMERSVRDNATDDELTEIMNIVDTIKCDSEERTRYMGIMNVIDYEKRDAYEEGIERGVIRGIIQACKSLGVDQERAAQELIKYFPLTPDKAQEYVSLFWDTPLNNQP